MCLSSVCLWNFAQKEASYERPIMQRFMGNAVLTDNERREIKSPQTKQSSTKPTKNKKNWWSCKLADFTFRLQSEKIAPIATSFMYIIIDWIQFWKNVPIIFKSHSIDPSWPHQRLAGLAESMVNFGQASPSPGQDWQSGQLRNSYDKDETLWHAHHLLPPSNQIIIIPLATGYCRSGGVCYTYL